VKSIFTTGLIERRNNILRYLANEKRDKAAAVASLDELKASAARDKEALERKASIFESI
jgi:hypothetical protein